PDDPGGREGEGPGGNRPPGHVPADLGALLAEPGADDRPGRDVGGGQRVAETGRQQDDRSGGGLSRHALRRLDLHQALAQGADHPPAADVGAEADRYRAGDDDPERRGRVGGQRAVRDQGQRDDAHRLLRVVRAVRQGHHGGRADLPDPEAVVAAPGGEAAANPVEQPGAGHGDQHRDGRRQHGREDDLSDQAVPLDRLGARGGQHRAGGDRGSHRVARVMEPVGEVEGEGRYHHKAQYYVVAHLFRVATRKLGVETPETTANRYSPAV